MGVVCIVFVEDIVVDCVGTILFHFEVDNFFEGLLIDFDYFIDG